MRHFVANIWRRQKKKEVVKMLKSLCACRTKEKFEDTLAELQKVLNATAKSWLQDQMPQRDKWALAFNVSGLRYGVMTTNSSESFNKVFKGICAVPVSSIVEYSFRKYNEYFVNRWNIAKASKEKWGRASRRHLDMSETIASNQVGEAFGPSRLVYNIRSAGGTNPGARSTAVGIIWWILRKENALVTSLNFFMCLAPMSL
jgi:S-adenosylmethionine synthetase